MVNIFLSHDSSRSLGIDGNSIFLISALLATSHNLKKRNIKLTVYQTGVPVIHKPCKTYRYQIKLTEKKSAKWSVLETSLSKAHTRKAALYKCLLSVKKVSHSIYKVSPSSHIKVLWYSHWLTSTRPNILEELDYRSNFEASQYHSPE